MIGIKTKLNAAAALLGDAASESIDLAATSFQKATTPDDIVLKLSKREVKDLANGETIVFNRENRGKVKLTMKTT